MTDVTGPFFEVSLALSDGRQIALRRFATVQDAMAVAGGCSDVVGVILYYEDTDSEPVPVIVYSADGSIEIGDAVPDDDADEDDPWTDAEIEHNFRVSREIAERKARGESVRSGTDGVLFARSGFESSFRYCSAVLFGRFAAIDHDAKAYYLQVLLDTFIPVRFAELRASTVREQPRPWC